MDEPPRPAPTHPTSVAPKRMRRGVMIAVGVPAFLLGVVLAAHRPLLGIVVRSRAAALGFDLDFDTLRPGLSTMRLERARVSLSGVKGVRVAAASVKLQRSGLSIDTVDADGVVVTIEGPASDRVLEVASWSGDHADAYRLRGAAANVRLEWRARPDTPAWLTMTGGSFTTDGTNARFTAATTSAFGVPMGSVGASFAVEASGVTIEAGKKPGADAPVIATLKTAARPPTVAITLRPVELSALGASLGLSLPAHGAVASGRAELALGRGAAGTAGTASLDLDGWMPQHPRVLDGVLAGARKTTVRTRLHLSEDRATVKLDDLEVRIGRLDLKGSGSIAAEGNHAMIRFDVGGPVPCADMARTMAHDELGSMLGSLAGDLAGQVVTGSTVLGISVEADARDLGAAKVKPRVGVGCKLALPGL